MKDFLNKLKGQIVALWQKGTLVQKLIFGGILLAVVAGIVLLTRVSASPALSPVIDAPIADEEARNRIITRINQEGVKTSLSASGVIMVDSEKTAQRMRGILIREDLIPRNVDPWAIFDEPRWNITDFERNVNLQRSITKMVTDHIKALDDVDDASVVLVMPEKELFTADQNPVSASVTLFPKPGSDITGNRKKIEGIQKLLKLGVAGLQDENIVITDQNGLVLNDFSGMAAMDRLELIAKEAKLVQTLEAQYRAKVLKALQSIYTTDRVRDLNLKIDMDMSKKAVKTEEFFPIELTPDNPDTPYDDSSRVNSITRSKSTSRTTWEGVGPVPEGPAGVEGQTPPAYRDMSQVGGRMNQETLTQNEEVNTRQIEEERSPRIDRVTVSVNIDGRWEQKYDEKGKLQVKPNGALEREYLPLTPEEITAAERLIQNAIGYNQARGDSVTVQNIPFDRTAQQREEDAAYSHKQQVQLALIILVAGVLGLLLFFLVFRLISREIERRRRVRDEEQARRNQMQRESAIRNAADAEASMVSMSVEERKRMELQENAVSMAREHPQDVAQLIRTWLIEE